VVKREVDMKMTSALLNAENTMNVGRGRRLWRDVGPVWSTGPMSDWRGGEKNCGGEWRKATWRRRRGISASRLATAAVAAAAMWRDNGAISIPSNA